MNLRIEFKLKIKKMLDDVGYNIDEKLIEVPKDLNNGDFAVPCFVFSKTHRKSPHEIAMALKNKLKTDDYISQITAIGPYLNFFINKVKLADALLPDIKKSRECFASMSHNSESQKLMIEFCSPNTNKPLHLGHIRNMVLGESVSNLLKHSGNNVVKSCLVNDRGVHICKSMLAYKLWGKNSSPKSEKKKGDHFVGDYYVMYAKYEDNEMKTLVQEMLQKWEDGDKETLDLWKKMNAWVFEGFNETYEKLGISFDKFYYESEFYDKGKNLVMKYYDEKKFKKKDGAIVAPLEKYNLPDKVLVRSDGTTIYMTQDIYLAVKKIEDYNLDSSIYVVGSEQNLHFQQLFKILEIMGYEQAKKCYHLSYGMVNLPDGKMKSREGTVVDADDIILELEEIALSEVKKRDSDSSEGELKARARDIALAGIKFFLLKQDSVKDMVYNPKESLSFEGETGPYIQYAAVRIGSIMEKSNVGLKNKVDFSRMEKSELDLVSELSFYNDVVIEAAEKMRPSVLANYLLKLSQKFNTYYHDVKIVDTGMEAERIYLINAIRNVLIGGLKLLGIDVPDKM